MSWFDLPACLSLTGPNISQPEAESPISQREAARDLEKGIEPIATGPSEGYKSIRSAEKILAPGEDWRYLGTDADPIVAEIAAEAAAGG